MGICTSRYISFAEESGELSAREKLEHMTRVLNALPDTFPETLSMLMTQSGITEENLEERSGISVRTISRLRREERSNYSILDYIRKKYPDLVPLYDAIYNKGDRSYFRSLEDQAERLAKEYSCPFVDNELPYGRADPGHPVIVDYFYHEEVRGSENTGRRNPKNNL